MTLTPDLNLLSAVEFDEEGFLNDPDDWTPELGKSIAAALGLDLTDRHWDVIRFLRIEYTEAGSAPTLRRISKAGGISTKELYALFPGGPAKIAAKIAGLHKPTGCI
jgi:tRNA 2-thiouridine synthesizing protein E